MPHPRCSDLFWLASSLALTGLALAAVAPWDLSLSRRLADPSAPFGAFVQDWGRLPARGFAFGVAALLAVPAWRRSSPLLVRASAALGAQFFLHAGLLTNLLKLLGGRTRPAHLGGAGEGFSPFYALAPGLGDFSFPSGHVAVSMVLAPCVLLFFRAGSPGAAAGLAGATAVWAGLVAYGRVLSGAHFPTDVLASVGLGIVLAPVSLALGDRLVARLSRTAA
ncbi:MAG: phosphatase PAP2 family protein [Myxococcales bacterium]